MGRYRRPGNKQYSLRPVSESQLAWFERWRRLFTTPVGARGEESRIHDLQAEDPIIGWTAANVLRHCSLDENRLNEIRTLASTGGSNALRWRAVHILGAFPNDQNVQMLLRRLSEDGYHWVRYGSLRSLLEIAARSPDLRQTVFAALIERLESLIRPPLAPALRRDIFVRDIQNPQTWLVSVGRLIRIVADKMTTTEEFQAWIRTANAL